MGVTTLVTHTSGQWISSQFAIKIENQKGMSYNQSCGTLLTYMRRYSAMSFAFLTAVGEDSDGIGKQEKAGKGKVEAKELAKPNPVTADTIADLTKIAKENGRDALNDAWKSLDGEVKGAITSADKAALKEVASNAHPS